MKRQIIITGKVEGYVRQGPLCQKDFSRRFDLDGYLHGGLEGMLADILEEEGKRDFESVTGLMDMTLRIWHIKSSGTIIVRQRNITDYAVYNSRLSHFMAGTEQVS